MRNDLITTNQNAKSALQKAKNNLDITNKILAKKDDEWEERLWKWADDNQISEYTIPRIKSDLLDLEEINLNSNISSSTCEFNSTLASNFKNEYIQRVKIKTIPKEIFNLKNIKKIDLSNNNLSFVPKEISNFENLTSLNLSHNNINLLPDSLDKLISLEELNISYNKLNILPDNIIQLINLKYLFMKNNNLLLTKIQEKWLDKLKRKGGMVFN